MHSKVHHVNMLIYNYKQHDINVKQIAAGNLHSVIYSSPRLTPKSLKSYGIPEKIPEKFETIQHIPVRDLQERLISLNEISNLVK